MWTFANVSQNFLFNLIAIALPIAIVCGPVFYWLSLRAGKRRQEQDELAEFRRIKKSQKAVNE